MRQIVEGLAAAQRGNAAPISPARGAQRQEPPPSFEFAAFLPDAIPVTGAPLTAVPHATAAEAPQQPALWNGPSFTQSQPRVDDDEPGMADAEHVNELGPQTKSDESRDIVLVHEERDLRPVITMMARDQRDRARETHGGIISLVVSLGHKGRQFGREATQRLRAVVSEVYFAPRVTDAARRHPRLGCIPGLALDITATDDEGSQ